MQAPPRSAGSEREERPKRAGDERPERKKRAGDARPERDARFRIDFCTASVETKDAKTAARMRSERPSADAIPVLRGRNIWHYTDRFHPVDLWTSEETAYRAHGPDLRLHRLAVRGITGVYNQRTLIATIIPPYSAVNNTVHTSIQPLDMEEMLLALALFNSFVADWEFRLTVNTSATAYFFHQLHLPWPDDADPLRAKLVQGAAALVCTRPEFDPLRCAACLTRGEALASGQDRWCMECRLHALAARAYGLDARQFAHVLSTFPIIAPETKERCLYEFDRLEDLL